MLRFIERWLRPSPPAPGTRLSEQQALDIARGATADSSLSKHLSMVVCEAQATGTVWIVASATRGSSLQVVIDDASGKVLKVKHLGVR